MATTVHGAVGRSSSGLAVVFRRSMLRALVMAAVLTALFAASAAATTSKTYAAKADAACADYKTRVARLPQASPTDMAAVYKGSLAVLTIARQDVARIRALPLPPQNRPVVRAWLATRTRLLLLLGALRDAAKNQDAQTVAQTENALSANGATAHRLARELGMKVCSTGS